MSVSSATLLESRTSAYLSHYGIRERIAGLQNLSSAKMNQRPKLGSEQGALNVRNWVLHSKPWPCACSSSLF